MRQTCQRVVTFQGQFPYISTEATNNGGEQFDVGAETIAFPVFRQKTKQIQCEVVEK